MLLYQRTPISAFDLHWNGFSFTPTQHKTQKDISCRHLQRRVYFGMTAIAQVGSSHTTNFNPFTVNITSSLSHELQQSLSRAFLINRSPSTVPSLQHSVFRGLPSAAAPTWLCPASVTVWRGWLILIKQCFQTTKERIFRDGCPIRSPISVQVWGWVRARRLRFNPLS